MIEFKRKPGLASYYVTRDRYTKIGNTICMENIYVTGYGRFHEVLLPQLWNMSFIKVFEDGDHMCCLVGPDLQEGVAEFYPLVPGKDHFDQITDCGTAYAKAHPEVSHADRFTYWEAEEIKYMGEQSRCLAA